MTGKELLAQISADPDDDQKRIAYADHVAQFEPEYAEFVRLQVARAQDERQRKLPYGEAGGRERELLRKHELEWARYIQKFVRPSATDQGWGFQRGFIAFARMEPENFVALGQRLFDMAPIQHADLYGGEDPVRPLFDSPFLARLDSLSLAGAGLDDDDAIALAACTALTRCTWLDLSDNKIGARGVEALAASRMMANKVVVIMKGNPCDPVVEPHYDWDGSIADYSSSADAKAIEARLGRVPWFDFPWGRRGDVPDRFHAKWVGRPSGS